MAATRGTRSERRCRRGLRFASSCPRATLTFAPAVLSADPGAVLFVVSALDAMGTTREICRRRVTTSEDRVWADETCSLASLAGQSIELQLAVERESSAFGSAHSAGTRRSAVAALWGSPTILTRTRPRLPYNVLWIALRAVRPDAIASFHDEEEDRQKLGAPLPPLDALLSPGRTPNLDALATRGVRFLHAYSAASTGFRGVGFLAMFAGGRATELGLPAGDGSATRSETDLPVLPRVVGARGAMTTAFMVGDASVDGVTDLGFERVVVRRDVPSTTREAAAWIRQHVDARFFSLVRLEGPAAPLRGTDAARRHVARAVRDDEAVGDLVRALDVTGLQGRTIVVVTSPYGEVVSAAHERPAEYEEATRVPLLLMAPGLLPQGGVVRARVSTVDIAPTVRELLGLETSTRHSGRSLARLASGLSEEDARTIVTEGRSRAVIYGRYRLVAGKENLLFDLHDDPGERRDIAPNHPEIVAEMEARLAAALAQVPVAGSRAATSTPDRTSPCIRLRFVGGREARRVSGSIMIGSDAMRARSFAALPFEAARESLRIVGERVEVALTTRPETAIGIDLDVDPADTPVAWEFHMDDRALSEDAVFAGPYGLLAPTLHRGIRSDTARTTAASAWLPPIDPSSEIGLFIVRGGRCSARSESR